MCMRLWLISWIVSLFLLNGCASDVKVSENTYSDPASVTLANAATSVSHTLIDLAAIEQATIPSPILKQPPEPASYGMAGQVSIDWTGPVEPLVQHIGKAVNYKVQVLGTTPAIPIIVAITAHQETLGAILRNVGYQCGKRAQIVVFPNSKVIELRYAHA